MSNSVVRQAGFAENVSAFRASSEVAVGPDGPESGQGDKASPESLDAAGNHIPDNVDFLTVYATVPGRRSEPIDQYNNTEYITNNDVHL